MGFMESAVVVYLREIYYPDGFDFPLKPIGQNIGITEILREAATLIMLITFGIIAGRTKTEKFGFFIYCFGIWDIFYYVFLKLLLGWPESLLTWDILFLIPVIWVGPVIGPVINSLTMILLAVLISYFTNLNPATRIKPMEWILFITGSVVIIISYIEDYISYMTDKFSLLELFDTTQINVITEYAADYQPVNFAWWIFVTGEVILLVTIYSFFARNKKALKN
jgi:hypothetical protein